MASSARDVELVACDRRSGTTEWPEARGGPSPPVPPPPPSIDARCIREDSDVAADIGLLKSLFCDDESIDWMDSSDLRMSECSGDNITSLFLLGWSGRGGGEVPCFVILFFF